MPVPGRDPIVIMGGFLSRPGLYRAMGEALAEYAAVPVAVVDVGLAHWAGSVSALGWRRILRALDATVRRMTTETGEKAVVLVGHSSGGVIARLYLAPDPFHGDVFAGQGRVSRLVTLGSPHTNQRIGRLRRWVDARYPGTYFAPAVAYTCVAGRLVHGNQRGEWPERLAFRLYRSLSGNGSAWGDGLVPVTCALLPGADAVLLDGVGHAPVGGCPWYGSPEVVRRWWDAAVRQP